MIVARHEVPLKASLVCHGKNCIVGETPYNITVFRFHLRYFVTPIIESVRTPARITPYATGRLSRVALSQALRARLVRR